MLIVHFIIICVNKINIKNRITTTKIETNKKQHKNLNTSDTNLFNTKNRHERLQINDKQQLCVANKLKKNIATCESMDIKLLNTVHLEWL